MLLKLIVEIYSYLVFEILEKLYNIEFLFIYLLMGDILYLVFLFELLNV